MATLLVSLIIAVYLFTDAKRHQKNHWFWFALGFLFGFLALGIYWIQTDRKTWGIIALAVYTLLVTFLIFSMILLIHAILTFQ